MPRTRALVRQWNLLRVLSQHSDGLSIEEMARQTNVNARTIRRDLKLFVEAGIPLRETISVRNKKRWRVDQHGVKVLPHHMANDLLALWTAEHLLQPLRDTRFFASFVRCRERLAAAAGPAIRQFAEVQIRKLSAELRGDITANADRIEDLWNGLASDSSDPMILSGPAPRVADDGTAGGRPAHRSASLK